MMEHIGNLQLLQQQKTKNGYDEELLHSKPLQSYRSAHTYMDGY